MDGTRSLAAHTPFAAKPSRRQLLKVLGGGVAGGLLALVGTDREETAAQAQDDITWRSSWQSAPPNVTFTSPPVMSLGAGLDIFVRGSDGALWWLHRGEYSPLYFTDWGSWQQLPMPPGVTLTSPPAAVSWGADRVDVFGLGSDGALYQWWYQADLGGWHPPFSLGAPANVQLTLQPSAVSWGVGRLDVFLRGSDANLWHRWYDLSLQPQSWGHWEVPSAGKLASAPSAVSWGPGRLDIFALGHDARLYQWWFQADYGGWHPVFGLGAPSLIPLVPLAGTPTAISVKPGTLNIFAPGSDGLLYHEWFDGQAWGKWAEPSGVVGLGAPQPQGGIQPVPPTVAGDEETGLDVFALAHDGTVWHTDTPCLRSSTVPETWGRWTWNGWHPLGVSLLAPPVALLAPHLEGEMEVFGLGPSQELSWDVGTSARCLGV
jgi:hypothetical protein